mmetsp:Transcript_36685/g.82512  ORF Transcript_36685/g.82512 Transcript_36685/m.82512 type:complete len:575 (+) Transcript_36685:130-1854(+)
MPQSEDLVVSFLTAKQKENVNVTGDPREWISQMDASSLEYVKGLASETHVIQGADGPNSSQVSSDVIVELDGTSLECINESGSLPPVNASLLPGKKDAEMPREQITLETLARERRVREARAANTRNDSSSPLFKDETTSGSSTEKTVLTTREPCVPMQNSSTAAQSNLDQEELTAEKKMPSGNLMDPPSNARTPVEQEMLALIRAQQRQMQEMQTRLDALGSMMARVEQVVLAQQNGHQTQRQMMGGLFAGGQARQIHEQPQFPPHQANAPQPPLPPDAAGLFLNAPPQGQAAEHQRQAPEPPLPPLPLPALAQAQPVNQGIFFPILVRFFMYLPTIPNRLATLVQNSGVARVYTHLRQRAIDLRAFGNVDLASLIKLAVMLLIMTSRVGNNKKGTNRRPTARENNNEENNLFATLVNTLLDFLDSHRIHTLVLAAGIAFLIQVGLMSFFHRVLWLERAELYRVWMGRVNQPEEPLSTEAQPEASDQEREGNGGQHGGIQAAHAEEAGGLFRRGPNNGGVLHDIQCLILSFLLSLIPAWRPEDAAVPEPEPEQPAGENEQRDNGPDGVQGNNVE